MSALARVDDTGASWRETLEGLIRRARTPVIRARHEAELDGPGMPDGAIYLWNWFRQLHARAGGEMGPGPIRWSELDAWARRMRLDPAPWEIDILMAIDDAWRRGQAGRSSADSDDD